MRQRSSQIVFLLLLLCAVPLGEPHVLGLARTFTGADGLLSSSAARTLKAPEAAGMAGGATPYLVQRKLSPAARLALLVLRPALHPGVQAADVAGYTGFERV